MCVHKAPFWDIVLTRTGLELATEPRPHHTKPVFSQDLTGSAKTKDDLGGLQGPSIAGRSRVTPRDPHSTYEKLGHGELKSGNGSKDVYCLANDD